MAQNDDLFGNLDSTMSFLQDKKEVSKDGIYRVDLKRVQDKKRGYKSTIRFLPNFKKDGTLGDSAVEKISHYVDLKSIPELSGYYDSAKNPSIQKTQPGKKCPLSDTYYALTNSKNATLVEKAKVLKYSKKYFSYVLILEDEQQPELVGKVMIFQYGKTIKDKITSEKTGEISGESCNIFKLDDGKDFVLLVKEVDTGDGVYPDYKNCSFKGEKSSIKIPTASGLKNVPLEDGKISDKHKDKVKELLLTRDVELENFEPKPLTEEQEAKVSQIIGFLTGKTVGSYASEKKNEIEDFSFDTDDIMPKSTSTKSNSDDFDFDDI